MKNPKENTRLMRAVDDYLAKNHLTLPNDADFQYCIDGVLVFVDDKIVLMIGDRPNVTDYPIAETEHTDKYLRQPIAAIV